MPVYGYTRVSTDRQADEGESLGAQQRVIEGYAMMLGLTLDEIFVERGVSGSKPPRDRPEGSRRRADHAEARSHVPVRPRRAPCPRPDPEARRQPPHDRS